MEILTYNRINEITEKREIRGTEHLKHNNYKLWFADRLKVTFWVCIQGFKDEVVSYV